MAKEQFGHSYTFWTMAIMIFRPVSNSSNHPLYLVKSRMQFNATSVKSNKMGSHCARTTESSMMMVIIVEKPIFWTLTVIAISFWVTQARLENNNKWVSLRAITNTSNNNKFKTSHFLANLGKIAIVHAVMYYMLL